MAVNGGCTHAKVSLQCLLYLLALTVAPNYAKCHLGYVGPFIFDLYVSDE